jgi:hypothetical protein
MEPGSEVALSRDPTGRVSYCGDQKAAFEGLGGALVIPGAAPAEAGSGEGARDDPAHGSHDETGVGALSDHLVRLPARLHARADDAPVPRMNHIAGLKT